MGKLIKMFEDFFNRELSAFDFACDFPHELCKHFEDVEKNSVKAADYMNEIFPELCDEIGMFEDEETIETFRKKVRIEYEKIKAMIAEEK